MDSRLKGLWMQNLATCEAIRAHTVMNAIALPKPARAKKGAAARKPVKRARKQALVVASPPKRNKKWMTEFRSALRAEIANCLTHGIGAGLSMAGLAILVSFAAKEGDPWKLVSFTIYGSAMVILYLASTLYHAFLSPRAKKIFKILDHSAIFIAIAGTYTPFTLVSLRGPWGWTLFGVAWGLAILGITFKIFFVNRFRLLSVVVYILMGWMVVIAQQPVRDMIPPGGIAWMVAGGLSYTAGTAFYASRKPMSHMIWHLFVLVGSICHYMAVLFYVLPAPVPA